MQVNLKPSVSILVLIIFAKVQVLLFTSTYGNLDKAPPLIASVTNGGVVIGLDGGTSTLLTAKTSTGCDLIPRLQFFTIKAKPSYHFTGPDSICLDGNSHYCFNHRW